MNETLTLFELNTLVRELIESEMSHEYWVEAELSECRERGGHCYMELVQKEELSNTPIARASAKCWRSAWSLIQPHFERVTGQELHAGMKVRLKVYAQFHEAFGFSWIITDIDPTYTLGDMARRRQEIIRQLKEEGIFDLQKELSLPVFCQNIAVISSENAAGYGDFCQQLSESPFVFHTELFPAIMQGEQVEQSIIQALNSIFEVNSSLPFDCVVIIRGGGATADMSGFDTLALAENVANFPIPIITGIGHDRDECILDMVSHQRVKTPTAAAAFLIDHLQSVYDGIEALQDSITNYAKQRLSTLNAQLSTIQEIIPRLFSIVKTRQEAKLDAAFNKLSMLCERKFISEQHRINLLEEKTKALDPALLLRRGYSITLHNGKAVRDPKALKTGDEIETRIEKGTIKSIIK